MEEVVRPQLLKMLVWRVGVKHAFQRNPGKCGKNLEQLLEPELWTMAEQTCADGRYEGMWSALRVTSQLFRLVATEVAGHFGFDYCHGDDARVSAHLEHVRSLPRTAQEMY